MPVHLGVAVGVLHHAVIDQLVRRVLPVHRTVSAILKGGDNVRPLPNFGVA